MKAEYKEKCLGLDCIKSCLRLLGARARSKIRILSTTSYFLKLLNMLCYVTFTKYLWLLPTRLAHNNHSWMKNSILTFLDEVSVKKNMGLLVVKDAI